MKGWTRIYRTFNRFQIPIIQAGLEDAGIVTVCMDKHDSNYLFGESELWCKSEDVTAAQALLNEMGYPCEESFPS